MERAWSTWTATSTPTSASATPEPWPATRPPAPDGGRTGARGFTVMLPTEDAAWVGADLARRFGVALLAVLAHRHRRQPLAAAHVPPGDRPTAGDGLQLVLPRLGRRGLRRPCAEGVRPARVRATSGPWSIRPTTTRAAEFNEIDTVEDALGHGDVACVLMEPALTNIGIVLPEPGFLEAVRELCTRHGALLIIDETHTLSAGPGGCTAAWGLEPDAVTPGQVDRRRRAHRRLRGERRARGADHRRRGGRLRGHRRGRRHAGRQRALAGGGAGHAGRGSDRRGLLPHERAARAVRRRSGRDDRRARGSLVPDQPRRPRGIPLQRSGAPHGGRVAPRRAITSWRSTCTCSCSTAAS